MKLALFQCAVLAAHCFAAGQEASTPKSYVQIALQKMGGRSGLESLRSVRFNAISHREMVEESERPEGPYVVEYDEVSELRDFVHNRFKKTEAARVLTFPTSQVTTIVADGVAAYSLEGHFIPATQQQIEESEENLALGPERILLSALADPNIRAEPDTILQSVPHHVVAFTWNGRPLRVFLNSYTRLPTAVEWTCAYPNDMFWSAWGNVTTRVYYSAWWLLPGGIHYPLQWDYFRNDLPDRVLSITNIETNVQLSDDIFAISPEAKVAFRQAGSRSLEDRSTDLGAAGQAPIELAKDVILLPGAWNTTLIRQPDGVVILEAPISSGYSDRVIREANRKWPNVPIKAVISTSDSWPHIAGVREYVARGIPIYALDLNIPILSRLVAAPHTIAPDSLTKAPRQADFRAVSTKTVLGEGPNRVEIYPLRGETTERQMMVYFPTHKLLYGSDSFQRGQDGTYTFPQTVWELMQAVDREKLSVDRFFMMHVNPRPWGDLREVIEKTEGLISQ